MTIKKLDRMPYANAHVEIDNHGNTYLFSYKTLVCELSNDGWFTCHGLYSATTRKHISAFMREYTRFDYQFAKNTYLEGIYINVETGEVEDW